MKPNPFSVCTIFLLFSSIITASTWMTPIDFDSAFNFQVASSLQEKFAYQTRYVPTKIYHNQITTNGPIQYYMALFISLLGLDLGRAIGLGIIGGITAASIYSYSRQSFVHYCLLLIFWPLFAELHTLFMGEILTIAMIMVGLSQWDKWHDCPEFEFHHHVFIPTKILASPKHWATGLAFGTAMATKLIAAGVIPLLVFCLFFHALRKFPGKSKAEQSILFAQWVITPLLIAFAFFMLQFSISILHSGGSPGSIIPTLKLFISEHLHQAGKAKSHLNLQDSFLQFNGAIILIIIFTSSVLAYRNIIFSLPTICIVVLIYIVNLDLRRILPLIVPMMMLAIKPISPLYPGSTPPHDNDNSLIVLILSGVTLISGCFLTTSHPYLIGRLCQFSLAGAPHNVAFITKDQTAYNEALISIIKGLDGPVFTTRWWQFPEISLRTRTIFYDRRAQKNSTNFSQMPSYLLFSAQNVPDRSTEKSLCGTILFRDGALILCEYHPNKRN